MAGGMSRPAHAIPLAAPRPGYPAPVANLKIPSPSPSGSPLGQSLEPSRMGQVPQALRVTRPQADAGAPRIPPPIYQTAVHRPSVPSAPHPLQPPMTPITPVFARPSKSPGPSEVKFSEGIIRGNSEDNLLPKRGEHGDNFWRRFSMVAKEEKKPSSWLIKTQNGSSSLSRWVWVVGMILLTSIGMGIGLWYYISHTNSSHQQPTAVGGSANETSGPSSSTAEGHASSSSPHVTPTFTLARRDTLPDPTPTAFTLIGVPPEDAVKTNVSRHNKKHRLRNF
ncbi:hypothetical protein J3R83DRAFT_13010 [Lanmaoa asiatica]|nr:hypothetical protein J3R83DRAFT_13010 [Lanmaoa asiatica]